MKIASIPKSGRVGSVIYSNGRYGKVARIYTPPANPQTPFQQAHRDNVRAVSVRWGKLTLEQHLAWGRAAAERASADESGSRVRRSGYHWFVGVNTRRADLGLPEFDLPPARPFFRPNPVAELVLTNTNGQITIKLRVPSQPGQYTMVHAPAPTGTGVRFVQHFHFLGLLPPPVDGWSDITALYQARYGVPKFGRAIWIRTCQHLDGWTDVPKITRARVPAPSP